LPAIICERSEDQEEVESVDATPIFFLGRSVIFRLLRRLNWQMREGRSIQMPGGFLAVLAL
jgi:hypothetical protein